uniref:Uncharacterized protein n=1 Tax=Strongyloides stercoralis TaxID=6248 RepID=A0AAF5DER8_STRER
MNNSTTFDLYYSPVEKHFCYHAIFGGYQIFILICNLIILIKGVSSVYLIKMPLLRINILILTIAFTIQSILQGAQSVLYVFSFIFHKDINIEICSGIRLFGNTVHGIVDFIPFSLAVIRYNIIFRKNKRMIVFWLSQILLVVIRLTRGIYPTVSNDSKYVPNGACGYVKAVNNDFMMALNIFSVSSEIVFPIVAFIINIIILKKVLKNFKKIEKENEKKEQKQLFWSMTIQILMPFFCHLPSIHLFILRLTGFKETVIHVIIVDTLNTIAYSSSYLSIDILWSKEFEKMPLLKINIRTLTIAYIVQSCFQIMPSFFYFYAYILECKINVLVCSGIKTFGNTVHGTVDFIPFSLSIVRYNKVVRQTNKHFWIFWIFQLFFIIIRMMAGIYPTISQQSTYEDDYSCTYVLNIHDFIMNILRLLALTFEIIFPIFGFVINIIILYKTLNMFKLPTRKEERKEQKQLFWFMTIQILIPFILHIPSIHVFILRIIGKSANIMFLFVCETLNTFAYSTSVFVSTLFVPKLRPIFFGICYVNSQSNNRTVKRISY